MEQISDDLSFLFHPIISQSQVNSPPKEAQGQENGVMSQDCRAQGSAAFLPIKCDQGPQSRRCSFQAGSSPGAFAQDCIKTSLTQPATDELHQLPENQDTTSLTTGFNLQLTLRYLTLLISHHHLSLPDKPGSQSSPLYRSPWPYEE